MVNDHQERVERPEGDDGSSRAHNCATAAELNAALLKIPIHRSLFRYEPKNEADSRNDLECVGKATTRTLRSNRPYLVSSFLTLGAIYVAAWSAAPELLNYVLSSDDISLGSPRDYLLRAPPYIAVVAIFGGMFLLIGRYWRLIVAADRDSIVASKSQFSILNLLLLTAAAAILMAMIRESRSAANVQSFYGMIVTTVLGFSIYFCNTACAAFAALSPTPIKRNCALVICVSALLGIAISLASGQVELDGGSLLAGRL